jgi:hypothetical protein
MSPKKRQPPVVAELGRPETPAETAARQAEASRNHRSRQTVNNLIYSLLATVAVVAVIVLLVPRGQPGVTPNVDYATIAAQAQGAEPDPLVSPKLPAGWKSNSAMLRTKTPDGIDSWYIGLITPSQQYVGVTQGFKANPTWLAVQVNQTLAKGTTTIDGVLWDVYDNRNSGANNGNVAYALTTAAGASTYVVFGTATPAEIEVVARALVPAITANGATQ